MHAHTAVNVRLLTFWRDFETVGRGHWERYSLARRIFRLGAGWEYRSTHLYPEDGEGRALGGVAIHTEPRVLAAHYAWVKPLPKIRAKLEYYRRQNTGQRIAPDYLDAVFHADLAEANARGTFPAGGGYCEPWSGRQPEPIQRRLEAGGFAWSRPAVEPRMTADQRA